MKYSIIINPNSKKSLAQAHALKFVSAAIANNAANISVFFYGYAVKHAFFNDKEWNKIANKQVRLVACSTIAETFLQKDLTPVAYFTIAGLGQWMESVLDCDKRIEFV